MSRQDRQGGGEGAFVQHPLRLCLCLYVLCDPVSSKTDDEILINFSPRALWSSQSTVLDFGRNLGFLGGCRSLGQR